MKNTFKIIGIGIVIFIILIQNVRIAKKEYKIETQGQIIDERNAHVERIELDNGKIISEKLRVTGEFKELSRGYTYLKDSLKEMGIKAKEMKTALFLARETKGEGMGKIDTVTISDIDTVYMGHALSIQEPFFSFYATIYPSNEYQYHYSIFDSLSVVNTVERRNIFSAREYKVKVYNSNPKTIVTGMTSLTIKERQYKWVAGPMFGYGVGMNGSSPFVGFGIMRAVVRF